MAKTKALVATGLSVKKLVIARLYMVFKALCPHCDTMIYCNSDGKILKVCPHIKSIDLDNHQIFFKRQ